VTRLLACCALVVILAGCQNPTHPVFSPAPSPSPHTQATAAVLQPADVPAGLTVCLGSGPIEGYLATLAVTKPAASSPLAEQWLALLAGGAVGGAVSVYASAPTACSAEFGASSSARAASGVVVAFGDQGQADRAWVSGVFGFAPPAAGEVAPGITLGSSTGLGPSSFVYVRGPARLACWQRSVFVALVIASNLDQAAFTAAATAVDARLH
jgi:hypothetical protein